MPRYLVTGGAGFIGSNLVEYLVNEGESVRVIDNFSTGNPANIEPFLGRVEFMEGSLTCPEMCAKAVAGVQNVLHQAAIPSVPRSVADPMASHTANVTGTLNLLLAARDAGVKRVVYAGSSSAYGNQEGEYKREDMTPSPLSPYAVSKLAGEHYLRAFSECYGLETVSLRYFNVFGPRQAVNSAYGAVIPLFISAALAGRSPVIYGDGLQARDFTFVENNVRANILAATGDFEARGQVYNVACGTSYTVLGLLEAINKAADTAVRPTFAAKRMGDVILSKADISRARADLGYEVFVSFEEGLRRTIEWYKHSLRDTQPGDGNA